MSVNKTDVIKKTNTDTNANATTNTSTLTPISSAVPPASVLKPADSKSAESSAGAGTATASVKPNIKTSNDLSTGAVAAASASAGVNPNQDLNTDGTAHSAGRTLHTDSVSSSPVHISPIMILSASAKPNANAGIASDPHSTGSSPVLVSSNVGSGQKVKAEGAAGSSPTSSNGSKYVMVDPSSSKDVSPLTTERGPRISPPPSVAVHVPNLASHLASSLSTDGASHIPPLHPKSGKEISSVPTATAALLVAAASAGASGTPAPRPPAQVFSGGATPNKTGNSGSPTGTLSTSGATAAAAAIQANSIANPIANPMLHPNSSAYLSTNRRSSVASVGGEWVVTDNAALLNPNRALSTGSGSEGGSPPGSSRDSYVNISPSTTIPGGPGGPIAVGGASPILTAAATKPVATAAVAGSGDMGGKPISIDVKTKSDTQVTPIATNASHTASANAGAKSLSDSIDLNISRASPNISHVESSPFSGSPSYTFVHVVDGDKIPTNLPIVGRHEYYQRGTDSLIPISSTPPTATPAAGSSAVPLPAPHPAPRPTPILAAASGGVTLHPNADSSSGSSGENSPTAQSHSNSRSIMHIVPPININAISNGVGATSAGILAITAGNSSPALPAASAGTNSVQNVDQHSKSFYDKKHADEDNQEILDHIAHCQNMILEFKQKLDLAQSSGKSSLIKLYTDSIITMKANISSAQNQLSNLNSTPPPSVQISIDAKLGNENSQQNENPQQKIERLQKERMLAEQRLRDQDAIITQKDMALAALLKKHQEEEKRKQDELLTAHITGKSLGAQEAMAREIARRTRIT